MTADVTFIGWLLVVTTVVGLAMIAHPALLPIWTMPREEHVATVAAHRVAWSFLNAGFVLATIGTAAALVALSAVLYSGTSWFAPVLACGVAYSFGGLLWCAVLAIRTRTTPLLHELGPEAYEEQPVRVLDALTGSLFQAFVLICSIAVTALGVTLLLAGGVASLVCIFAIVIGAGLIMWLLTTGDVIPAVLYLPTLVLGIALLAGWN